MQQNINPSLPLENSNTKYVTSPSPGNALYVNPLLLSLSCRFFLEEFTSDPVGETVADTRSCEHLMMVTFKKKSTSQPEVVKSLSSITQSLLRATLWKRNWVQGADLVFFFSPRYRLLHGDKPIHQWRGDKQKDFLWPLNTPLTFQWDCLSCNKKDSGITFTFLALCFQPCTWLSEKHQWPAAQAWWWVPCFGL